MYLVEAHHHSNPIFFSKHDSPRIIDDRVVMLVLEAHGIPLRFGEVQLSLITLNPKLEVFYALSDNQMSGPLVDGRSKNLLVFRWEVLRFKLSNASSLAEPVHKCGDITGRSSSKGFHQSCLKFTLGICALPMSSSSDDCACSSGAYPHPFLDLQDDGRGGGGGTWDDPEAPGALEAPDGPAGGGGGGG
nr:hypothetical protein [Tanacetum cinerariifolium]